MNTAELIKIRQDLVKMVAILQPELQVEIARIEAILAQTEAAAAIIGTKEQADASFAEAVRLVEEAQKRADVILGEAALAKGDIAIAQAQQSASQKLLDEGWEKFKDEKAKHQESVSIHLLVVRDHEMAHKKRMDELNDKATGLGEWEARLHAKEQEMLQRVARMKEAIA